MYPVIMTVPACILACATFEQLVLLSAHYYFDILKSDNTQINLVKLEQLISNFSSQLKSLQTIDLDCQLDILLQSHQDIFGTYPADAKKSQQLIRKYYLEQQNCLMLVEGASGLLDTFCLHKEHFAFRLPREDKKPIWGWEDEDWADIIGDALVEWFYLDTKPDTVNTLSLSERERARFYFVNDFRSLVAIMNSLRIIKAKNCHKAVITIGINHFESVRTILELINLKCRKIKCHYRIINYAQFLESDDNEE